MGVLEKLDKFYESFNGQKGLVGYSSLRRSIYYFLVEKSSFPTVLVQCAIHAREYITTLFCLKEIESFILNGKCGRVYFLPNTNPDGTYIAEKSNPLFKENANNVDLNNNFDAKWGQGRGINIGKNPFSEVESRLLRDFTLKVLPDMTVSYHTKGEEIYYNFYQSDDDLKRDLFLARLVEKHTGYRIKELYNSVGGYKDWCIEKLGIPSLTIEVGSDKFSHPLKTKRQLLDICKKNLGTTKVVIEGLIKWKSL